MNKNVKSVKMHELPESQRPYERFYRHGPESLSDQELLAIILGSGSRNKNALETAAEILSLLAPKEGMPELNGASVEELMQVKGVGKSKAIRVKAALECGKRSQRQGARILVNCSNPDLIVEHYRPQMENLPREELRALFLDCKNKLIRDTVVARGGLNSAMIDPRDLFREAVKANAASMILLHNHPSGDPKPSQEDLRTTRRFFEAGHMLGIRLHDHIIIGKNSFVSLFADDTYKELFAM